MSTKQSMTKKQLDLIQMARDAANNKGFSQEQRTAWGKTADRIAAMTPDEFEESILAS